MGEDMSHWDEYIKEHSDLEWNGEDLTEPVFHTIVAYCTLFFDTGN